MGLLFVGLIYTGACVFLILVILLQSGKGGGLSGMLGGGNPLTDTLGATGAEKTLNRWTTACAVIFFLLSLFLTFLGGRIYRRNILSDKLKAAASPVQVPPQTTPGTKPVTPLANQTPGTYPQKESPEEGAIPAEEMNIAPPEAAPPTSAPPATK